MGSHSLLLGIFPTQGANPGLSLQRPIPLVKLLFYLPISKMRDVLSLWALEWGLELTRDEQQHEWEINGYCWATEIWGVIYCHSLINLRWLNRKWCSKMKCCFNARKIQNFGFGVSHGCIEKTIMKAGKMETHVCSGKTIICYFLLLLLSHFSRVGPCATP